MVTTQTLGIYTYQIPYKDLNKPVAMVSPLRYGIMVHTGMDFPAGLLILKVQKMITEMAVSVGQNSGTVKMNMTL